MAENLVVNDVTYPEVDAVTMTNEAGEKVAFYSDAVRYNPQTLTDAQKEQARENIGALSDADVDDVLRQAKESGEFDGKSVTITEVQGTNADGGENKITFSNGSTMVIRNGRRGSSGSSVKIESINHSGEDGGQNTVIFSYVGNGGAIVSESLAVRNGNKGSDANVTAENIGTALGYTPADQADVDKLSAEKTLLFADTADDFVDTNKRYALPDGSIHAYGEAAAAPPHNVLEDVGFTENRRINSSGGIVEWTSSDADVTGFIPVSIGDVISVENMTIPSAFTSGTYWQQAGIYSESKSFIQKINLVVDDKGLWQAMNMVVENGNVVQFTIESSVFGSNAAYIVINAKEITGNSAVYINAAASEPESGWVDTGLSLAPSSGGTAVPSYWRSELETKANTIQQAMEAAGRDKSAFLWYTDAHWPNNAKVSPALLSYLAKNTPMNKVNFGGDIVGDPSAFTHDNIKYVYEWRKMIADLPNHHSVPGNHDLDHDATDVRNMAYAFLIAPEESPDMVMGGKLYYYIDNPAEKTRYIYLDYMNSDHTAMMDQGQFLVDAIKDVSTGWHIVVIAHRWYQYTNATAPTVGVIHAYMSDILSVLDAYNARTSRAASNYFYEQDFATAVGSVEFCIGGHCHVDMNLSSPNGIPVIITASDANQDRSPDETGDSGIAGTTTEAAVYGIIADYTNGKIVVVGVGRGGSREIAIKKSGAYTNVLPLAQQYASTAPYVGIDGSVGYANNMRISTSLPDATYMKAQTGVDTTAMIPAKRGDVLRFKNCNLKVTPSNTSYGTYLYGFDSSKAIASGFNAQYNNIQRRLPFVINGDEIVQITLEPNSEWTTHNVDNVAFIMISTDGLDETSIITVNEEIT